MYGYRMIFIIYIVEGMVYMEVMCGCELVVGEWDDMSD